jgi:beta-glucosidase
LVTLHHFTNPAWFADRGGWLSPEAPKLFERYAEIVVRNLQDVVDEWITINEPNVYVYAGYIVGAFPPGEKSFSRAIRSQTDPGTSTYTAIHRLQAA